ncbi:hypothetical protein QOZ80_7BG0583140 [Eleusine coracana subsp. coracana]|nr:hypothetical protein QOZ80_7BG0583140 [Eleusine coracana subsp. coracana]
MKLLICSHLVVILLLLPLALAAGAAEFDFFFHVQLWPASYCSGGGVDCCYNHPPADFSMNGLWPSLVSCQDSMVPPEDDLCLLGLCNLTDSLNQIRDLRRGLRHNSASLSCDMGWDDIDLWSHEWTEHGTCSNMDQRSYFLAALDFKARFNLTRILLAAGIAPSNERAYELSRIRDAVTEATGSAPSVECNRNEQGEVQLYRVYQCVGVDGRSPIHCPCHLNDEEATCTDMVKFPQLQVDDY